MASEPRTEPAPVAASEAASTSEPAAASEPASPAAEAARIFAPATEAYRAALAEALEEARAALRTLRTTANGRGARAAEELGALALGPLDPDRFAALLDPAELPDPARLGLYEEAVAVLSDQLAEAASLAPLALGPADAIRDAVDRALRRRGRAFGAVRALALLRTGKLGEEEHRELLGGLPFRAWRSLERDVAPPLVMTVPGAALDGASSLGEFLDGRQRIVLLVEAPSPPAPLASLIAPGRLVLQAADVEALAEAAAYPGPVVAALVPDSAARFTWRPAAGEGEADRMELHHLPSSPPRGWVGGVSPRQQAAQLGLLEAWAARTAARATGEGEAGTGAAGTGPSGAAGTAGGAAGPASGAAPSAAPEGPPGPGPAPPRPDEPVERLAAWLLGQAGSGGTPAG